jgi:hypothetical protein
LFHRRTSTIPRPPAIPRAAPNRPPAGIKEQQLIRSRKIGQEIAEVQERPVFALVDTGGIYAHKAAPGSTDKENAEKRLSESARAGAGSAF